LFDPAEAAGAPPLLYRAVPAGFPSPADDFIEEEIDLQRLLIANRSVSTVVSLSSSCTRLSTPRCVP
jgi:DNA polymerase V